MAPRANQVTVAQLCDAYLKMQQHLRKQRATEKKALYAGYRTRCQMGKVVALIGVPLLEPVARSSPASSDGWHGVDSLFEHAGVMHMGGQGQATALYHNVALRAQAAAIDWI